MNDKNFYSVFFTELRNKWYIIVVLALVLGGGLIFEKSGSGNNVISVSTSAYSQQMIRVVSEDPNLPLYDIPDPSLFANSSLEKYSFMKESEKKYDYSKFNADFPALNEENKFMWLEKRLWVVSHYPNLFVVTFWVKDEDAKDLEYTNANVEQYVSDYIEFCSKKLQAMGIGRLEVVDKAVLPAEGTILPSNSFMLKYGIIGAVLGSVAGLLIIAGLAMRKVSNG